MTLARTGVLCAVTVTMLVACIFHAGVAAQQAQQPPDVDALLTHLDDLYRSRSSIATIEIVVTSPRTTRTLRVKAWTRGEEKVLAVIEAPPRERSQHPLAGAIVAYASTRGLTVPDAAGFQSITGAGASARVVDRAVYVGSPELFAGRLGAPLDALAGAITHLQEQGNTVILVGDERRVYAAIAVRDTLRANARRAIEALRAAGVQHVVM
ncbi:MAG: HAD family hydrolase [Vicinamibacterales bacterium]